MGNVLHDVAADNTDARYVLRRVDDWEACVKRLYATVGDWSPEGLDRPSASPGAYARQVDAPVRGGCAANPDASAMLAAEVGVVELGPAGEPVLAVALHHHLRQLDGLVSFAS